jgi:hypothetical protein
MIPRKNEVFELLATIFGFGLFMALIVGSISLPSEIWTTVSVISLVCILVAFCAVCLAVFTSIWKHRISIMVSLCRNPLRWFTVSTLIVFHIGLPLTFSFVCGAFTRPLPITLDDIMVLFLVFGMGNLILFSLSYYATAALLDKWLRMKTLLSWHPISYALLSAIWFALATQFAAIVGARHNIQVGSWTLWGYSNWIHFQYLLLTSHTNLKWTNPNAEARNRRATITFGSPTVRLRLAFGQHHKSNKVNH